MPKIIKNGISYGVPANLSDLYDTNITSPANGDIIQYTATTGQWENTALSGAFLPTTGGTMTGQIKTSFNQSVAMGSYQASANTIPDLCTELRYSSGCCGSFNLTTAYSLSGTTINTGWYNFLWIPHRSGGINGEATEDNCNFGSCYLSGMTVNGAYLLRFASSNPTYLCDLNSGEADYGGKGSTTKIKIKITSTAAWMLCFTVTLYQGYRATKVMVSGYNYGTNHWYQPEARVLGDSDNTETISVYFGYDSDWNLWVGFDGGNYTGVHIDDVTNGYTQVCKTGLFSISNVSSLATLQTTVTAASRANYANSAGSAGNVTGTVAIANGGTGATTKNNAGTNLGFNWSGQSGQPSWLWGGNNQGTYYVYNPSNFNVNSAKTATTATKGNTVANWSGGGTSGNLRFHAQISVLSISNGDSAALVNTSTLNTIFGVSNCSNANTAVFISNGDANACVAHVEGCNFLNNTWYACISYNTTCSIRVNWLAVYFG